MMKSDAGLDDYSCEPIEDLDECGDNRLTQGICRIGDLRVVAVSSGKRKVCAFLRDDCLGALDGPLGEIAAAGYRHHV